MSKQIQRTVVLNEELNNKIQEHLENCNADFSKFAREAINIYIGFDEQVLKKVKALSTLMDIELGNLISQLVESKVGLIDIKKLLNEKSWTTPADYEEILKVESDLKKIRTKKEKNN